MTADTSQLTLWPSSTPPSLHDASTSPPSSEPVTSSPAATTTTRAATPTTPTGPATASSRRAGASRAARSSADARSTAPSALLPTTSASTAWSTSTADLEHLRPRTTAECPTQRPCPWVACEHHLLITLRRSGQPQLHGQRRALPSSAAAALVRAWIEEAVVLLEQLPESCELDVTRHGAVGPRRIAAVTGIAKQRVDVIVKTRTPYVRAALTADDD